MARRVRQSVREVREALVVERERSMERWAIPGRRDEWLDGLHSGAPVVVSSAQLMCALMRAGLPHRQYAYGGAEWDKRFVLDERDQLSEWRG